MRISDWSSDVCSSDLRAQVQTSEAAVAEYRAQNGLFEASADSSVTQEELAGLNTQLAGARAQQAEAEARLSTARAQLAQGGTGEELGEALDSDRKSTRLNASH